MKHIISLYEQFKNEVMQPLNSPVQGGMPQIKVVFVGGLEHRPTDLKLDAQAKLLNDGLGKDIKEIQKFHHNDRTQVILDFLKAHPGVQVFLFSAGCTKALSIVNSGLVDKKKIYVIEPYAVAKGTRDTIQSAVNAGLPSSNVFVGSSQARGFGIVTGATNSNSKKGHWGALTSVGAMKKGL